MAKLVDGDKWKMVADDGCAKCMFATFACGTDMTFVAKVDGDGVTFEKYKYCGGMIYGSPCPCLSCCCCDGPHTANYMLKKQSDTLYVGDKSHSQWSGGCCSGMCHNDGDKMELKDGVWTFSAGKDNPVAPPCFKGKDNIMHMELVGGAPPMENATMER